MTGYPARPAKRKIKPREICFQCRNRKVRCDGKKGGCENCQRLQFKCSFAEDFKNAAYRPYDRSAQENGDLPVLAQLRPQGACALCYKKKTKCSMGFPLAKDVRIRTRFVNIGLDDGVP
ncbi:Nitrate assimilation regulatory protein [Penicillium herquei]|nr:Nitrate assimilation regulatory protein [Penicillium herquei]